MESYDRDVTPAEHAKILQNTPDTKFAVRNCRGSVPFDIMRAAIDLIKSSVWDKLSGGQRDEVYDVSYDLMSSSIIIS